MADKDMNNLVKFLFELGQGKKVKRSGWWLAGVKDPETIAEHMWRASILGRIIAELEGADQNKVITMLLFHDIPELRTNDLHKVGARYIKTHEAELAALKEQVQNLPPKIAKEMLNLWEEMHHKASKEAIIAKDCDYLECALQAKEYKDLGYLDCQDWINNVRKVIKTKTAKKILDLIEKEPSNSWWQGLKKIE